MRPGSVLVPQDKEERYHDQDGREDLADQDPQHRRLLQHAAIAHQRVRGGQGDGRGQQGRTQRHLQAVQRRPAQVLRRERDPEVVDRRMLRDEGRMDRHQLARRLERCRQQPQEREREKDHVAQEKQVLNDTRRPRSAPAPPWDGCRCGSGRRQPVELRRDGGHWASRSRPCRYSARIATMISTIALPIAAAYPKWPYLNASLYAKSIGSVVRPPGPPSVST